jgi:hypothetical protein
MPKYEDFLVSEPFVRNSKRRDTPGAALDVREYVRLHCPYCDPDRKKKAIAEMPLERLQTGRAFAGGQHVLVCAAAREAGVAPPVQRVAGVRVAKKRHRQSVDLDEGRVDSPICESAEEPARGHVGDSVANG